MYDVNIVNDYHFPIEVFIDGTSENTVNPNGGNADYKNWGNAYLLVPGMGQILFLDMGKKKLEEYTNPNLPWTEFTWGGLLRYQGLDAYFRYEGQGSVRAQIDEFGTLHFESAQGGMMTGLAEIVYK